MRWSVVVVVFNRARARAVKPRQVEHLAEKCSKSISETEKVANMQNINDISEDSPVFVYAKCFAHRIRTESWWSLHKADLDRGTPFGSMMPVATQSASASGLQLADKFICPACTPAAF